MRDEYTHESLSSRETLNEISEVLHKCLRHLFEGLLVEGVASLLDWGMGCQFLVLSESQSLAPRGSSLQNRNECLTLKQELRAI